MNTVLYASPTGVVYETRAYSKADITALVADHGLENLSSADRQFDFWFARAPKGCQRRVNRSATELLLATTKFTARNVPLLHGAVVIGTHDTDGDLDGLSWQQLDVLAQRSRTLSKRDYRVLERRFDEADRRLRRSKPAATPAAIAGVRHRTSVHA
ncbi:hypothetical protein E4P42_11740 [Mycobacterium sp. PS03-16]|uniref:hypothetical protein n=1 Tax=Mycobacterium sp. PS03-16 TaxID=2559611 RepID=UPI001073C098|nr:hypothetical protein [Mycobacterium sp. PS03-16]TFV58380.1 hypothetical protein E4P42_11740 [Mycobacterium sp. PS03-16]